VLGSELQTQRRRGEKTFLVFSFMSRPNKFKNAFNFLSSFSATFMRADFSRTYILSFLSLECLSLQISVAAPVRQPPTAEAQITSRSKEK